MQLILYYVIYEKKSIFHGTVYLCMILNFEHMKMISFTVDYLLSFLMDGSNHCKSILFNIVSKEFGITSNRNEFINNFKNIPT